MSALLPHQYRTRVHQASGMVAIQAGCSFEVALALMSDRAIETNQTIDAIADAVVDRRIRFSR